MGKGLHRSRVGRGETPPPPAFGVGVPPDDIRREREKARELRLSQWWKNRLAAGLCHYCGRRFPPEALTMDHVVPVARGGKSDHRNVVPCCKDCNSKKRALTPAEIALAELPRLPPAAVDGDEP